MQDDVHAAPASDDDAVEELEPVPPELLEDAVAEDVSVELPVAEEMPPA